MQKKEWLVINDKNRTHLITAKNRRNALLKGQKWFKGSIVGLIFLQTIK